MATKVANNVSEEIISPKKRKLTENSESSVHATIEDLSTFKVDKILSNNTKAKTVCIQGSFESLEGTGLVILEKTAFEEEQIKDSNRDYFASKSSLKKVFHNDIYGNYEYSPKVELNTLKTTIIHPATEKHIQKYSIQNFHLLEETPEIYKEITLPSLNQEQFNLQWVYNILEHKSEVERIVAEDTDPVNGFVLVPDLKWDGSVETLYLLAITQDRNIKSLRDLNGSHLPLLKNIKDECENVIQEKYGLDASQLRVYLHYQPSFYHLHIHFTYLRHEAPGIVAERAHLLANVISNIELMSDYYQRVTLPFTVRENDNLFKKLEEKEILRKVDSKN